MPSLTSCLKKAGEHLRAEDKAVILARAAVLRASGAKNKDASSQAVEERITEVRALVEQATPPKVDDASKETAQNVVREADAPYETDLFGDALPQSARRPAARPRAGGAADVQPAAAVPGDTAAPAGEYAVRTIVGRQVERHLGAARIRTAADAAAATSYLYKSAVERLDGIVVDKDGKPLAVVGGFKGAPTQSPVYPSTLIGELVRVPGAAGVWFSHNHPSGVSTLSRADEHMYQTLRDSLRGSGIEPLGILAIGDGVFSSMVGDGSGYRPSGPIPASRAGVKVPVIERELVPAAQALPNISSPTHAKDIAAKYYGQAKVPGLVLLDGQHFVVAWVPLPVNATGPLRGTGGLNAIYRAVSESNAVAAVIVHGGELDARMPGRGSLTITENIGAALRNVEVRVLDSIDAKTNTSAAERGQALATGPVFARSKVTPEERAATGDIFAEPAAAGDTLAQRSQAAGALIGEYRRDFGKTPSGMTQAGFRKFHDDRRSAADLLDAEILRLAQDGDGLLLPTMSGNSMVALHADPSAPGAWRTTTFTNDMEPAGHMEFGKPIEAATEFRNMAAGSSESPPLLAAQTPEDLRAKVDRAAAGEKADAAEQKRLADKEKADAQRGEFTLTGSDRAADTAAAAGQGALFERGAAGGLDAARVSSIAAAIRKTWANAPDVVVVSSMQDERVPAAARAADAAQRSQGAAGDPRGFFFNGKVYLVADGLRTEAGVAETLLHESLGHFGLRGTFGDALNPILDGLALSNASAVRRKAEEYGLDHTKRAERRIAAEEVLAEMAQTRPELGVVQRAVAAIRAWLRTNLPMLMEGRELSDAEIIREFIEPARMFVERGANSGIALGQERAAFSRPAAPFFSALARSIEDLKSTVAPAAGWRDAIRGLVAKGAVKQDEVEWTGVNEWLALQQGKVKKDQVLEYLAGNVVQVTETVLGSATSAAERLSKQLEPLGFSADSDIAGEVLYLDKDGEPVDYDELPRRAREVVDRASQGENGAIEGDTKYGQYQLPGGTNYREVLLTLPTKVSKEEQALIDAKHARAVVLRKEYNELLHAGLGDASTDTAETGRKLRNLETQIRMLTQAGDKLKEQGFKSSHWDQPNVLAHVRLNDRTDADGKRVLFVEEIQSDWGQAGKKQGFKAPYAKAELTPYTKADAVAEFGLPNSDLFWHIKAPDNVFQIPKSRFATMDEALDYVVKEKARNTQGPPNAPFVDKTDKWLTLALKRITVMAAQEGYDRVAFVTGEQSAERYDLSKQISKINVQPAAEEGFYDLFAWGMDSKQVMNQRDVPAASVEDYIGKDLAKKAVEEVEAGGKGVVYQGLDLKVGGEGLKAFYDKIVPSVLKDVLRKVGGGPATVKLPNPDSDADVIAQQRPGTQLWGLWDQRLGRWIEGSGRMDKMPKDEAEAMAAHLRSESRGLLQPGFDITPAMREKAAGGLPLFSRAPATDTPAFKRWFGDSKVVDAQGKPLVVYHGTALDLVGDAFNANMAKSEGGAFYFSHSPLMKNPATNANEYAAGRAGDSPNVVPAYLSMKNPLVTGFTEPMPDGDKAIAAWLGRMEKFNRGIDWTKEGYYKQAIREARAGGHDGVIIRNVEDVPNDAGRRFTNEADVYIAFRPEQIKSATGNRGTFDPTNPDIRFSRDKPTTTTTQSASGTTTTTAPAPRTGKGAWKAKVVPDAWLDPTNRVQFAPGQWLYNAIGRAASPLLTMAGLRAASPEMRRLLRQMKLDVAKAQETAATVARDMQAFSEGDRAMVSDIIEKELKAGIAPPEHAVRLAAVMNQAMGAQSKELVRLGMLSEEAAARWDGAYLPRFYESKLRPKVDAWADAVRKLIGRTPVMQGIKGKHLKGRGLFETIPMHELEKWQAMGWEVRDPDFKPEVQPTDGTVQVWRDFTREERDKMGEIRDAGFRFVMGYMQTQRDIAIGKMFETIANDDRLSSRTQREGWARVPDGTVEGTGAKKYGKLAGRYVPMEVLSQLSALDEAQSAAWQFYRKAMGYWKMGKTSMNPVSHMNNVVSNLSMAHFAGVSYHRADKYIGALRDFVTKPTMLQEAKDAGLFLGTMNAEELVKDLPKELQDLVQKTENKALRGAKLTFDIMTFFLRKPLGKAYEAEDLFFRYLIYKDARERGMEPQEAVDHAQRFIFTYDDLPKGARMIRDFGIPFFAYTYKAIPALLHTALTHPHRMIAPAAIMWGINALAYAIATDDDDDWQEAVKKYIEDEKFRERVRAKQQGEREHLPPWMKGMTALLTPKAIRLGMNEVTEMPLFIDVSHIIPGGDIFDVSPNAGGIPLPQPLTPSHPLFSMAVAMIANRDTWTGKDLVLKDADTSAAAAQKRAEWIWKQLSPAIAVGNYHWERTLNALAQATGHEVRVTWPLPDAIEARIPEAVAKTYTGVGRDRVPVQPGLAAMQTFGIKVRPIDLELSEKIDDNNRAKIIKQIDLELKRAQQLNRKTFQGRPALSDRALDEIILESRQKKDRLRDGLTVDGNKRD